MKTHTMQVYPNVKNVNKDLCLLNFDVLTAKSVKTKYSNGNYLFYCTSYKTS